MAISSGSILVDLFGVFTAIITILYVYIKWRFQYWKNKNVPYLEPQVPFGNFMNPFTKTMNEGAQFRVMYQQAKAKGWKYCGVYIMASPSLLILDLDLLKNVLAKDFLHFTDRGFYMNEKDDPLSAHLFALGGPKWRSLRTKLSPTFTSGKMKLMFQTLVDSGLVLEKFLNENISSNEPVDVKEMLGQLFTDIIGSCAFGIECNSFKEPNSPFRVYGKKMFEQTKVDSSNIAFCHAFPDLARALGVRAIKKDISKFYTKMVQDVVSHREKNNVTKKDFLQLLIEIKNSKQEVDEVGGDGKGLTMDELAAQCFIFFLAGFETSSTTASFALFELANHPDIQEKVRHEIKTVLRNHNNEMTYDSLSELKYMKQVIDETLRKFSPLPLITRVCVKDYKVPESNLVIEKGTTVIIPIEGIHYDEEYFKNANDFDPDRFTEENKKGRHAYAHIPFGEGPRICIGERFGIMQTKVALTSILRSFKVKLHERTKLPIKISPHNIVPTAEGDLWLTFEKI